MKYINKMFCCVLAVLMLVVTAFGCQKKETTADDKKLDTGWYQEDKSEFVLTTSGQLYGFAQLSQEKSFQGKTVKLGADMILNEVDATVLRAWKNGSTVPERAWTAIGNENVPFAGTFDGQGHTIKGLYLKTDEIGAGLFGWVAQSAVVCNFRLIDSYIYAGSGYSGVIGRGLLTKIENVYTNVHIETRGTNNGGILGWYQGAYSSYDEGTADSFAKGAMLIQNCWFDGIINCDGTKYATGGIVGGQNARSKVDIWNCLFSGKIKVSNATTYSRVGGIFGWLNWAASYSIKNCLSIGTIEAGRTETVGGLIGDLGAKGVSIKYSYCIAQKAIGKNQTGCIVPASCVQQKENFKNIELTEFFTKLPGEVECAWVLFPDGTPILKCFSDVKTYIE